MKRKISICVQSDEIVHSTQYLDTAPIYSEDGNVSVDTNLHPVSSEKLMGDDFDLEKLIRSGVEPDNFVATAQRSRFGLLNSIH